MFDRFEAEADAILAEQIRLCEIAAPTGQESKRADAVASAFESLGLDVQRDAVGNVIAHGERQPRRPLILSAHLDTVFGPDQSCRVARPGEANPYRRDAIVPTNEYHAPGISDAAAGLAAMLAVARALSGTPAAEQIVYAATVGEEGLGDLRGARHLFASDLGRRARAFITIDHSDAAAIVNAGIGSRRFRVQFQGRGGHSWGHFGRYNPAFALAAAADRLAETEVVSEPRTTFNIGVVRGGETVNAIPERAEAEVDLRSESASALDELERVLRDAVEAGHQRELARRSEAALAPSLAPIGDRPAGITPADNELVQAARRAIESESLTPRLIAASTDANAAIAAGVPAIAMSWGGRSDNQHSVREWFDPTDRARSLRVLSRILVELSQPDAERG